MKKVILFFIIAFIITFLIKNIFSLNTSSNNNSKINFKSNIHNFNNIKYLDKAEHYFIFQNTSDITLRIDSAYTSCGCTAIKENSKVIKPNATDSLLVTISTDAVGYFTREIIIYSNSSTNPDHLFIKGNVVE